MDVIEMTSEKKASDANGQQTLPVCLYLPEKTESEDFTEKKKKRVSAARVLSVAFSIIFSSVSLLYIAVQAQDLSDRLGEGGARRILINEVYGDARAKTPPQAETEAAETEAATDAEPPATAPEETTPPEPDKPEDEAAPSYPVIGETLANYDLLTSMSNETSYAPDMEKLLAEGRGTGRCAEIYKEYGADAPVVLIVHTHGTEAYIQEGKDTYTEEDPFRSSDRAQNVVAVGDVIEKVLESEGINVIHCTEMFDEESYRDSYSKSYAATAKYLEEYPSLAYVFDVHRDSVIRGDMTNIATLAYSGDRKIAQSMIVVGTDEGGADHPAWEDNLSLALSIQNKMMEKSDTLPRKINLRSAAFNQGLCSGSLLLEIGSCANTLTEAKCAAVLTAMSIAEAVTGESCSASPEEMISRFVP